MGYSLQQSWQKGRNVQTLRIPLEFVIFLLINKMYFTKFRISFVDYLSLIELKHFKANFIIINHVIKKIKIVFKFCYTNNLSSYLRNKTFTRNDSTRILPLNDKL